MKLKIAQVTPYYYPSIGGVAGVVRYLSEEFIELGHQVDVITARRDHKGRPRLSAPMYEEINGVDVYRYKSLINVGHMSFFPALISHLITHKYDVIHYHSYRHPLCEISSLFGRLNNSVCVLHGHSPFFEIGEINKLKAYTYKSYDRFAARTLLKWSHCIIALNSFEKANYLRLGIKEEKIIIVPNAAENICFDTYDPESFLLQYGIKGKKILLFVGILNWAKRPDLLVLAFPEILKEIPSAHLVFVGPDGGELEKIQILAKKLNLENHITITGALWGIDKQMAYASASIFGLPSDLDAYPLVLAEALAHGIPVVTTDARGPADIVSNGVNGYIIKKGDVKDLTEKIIRLFKDTKLYNQFSESAKQTARLNHSAPVIAKKIESLYFNLLHK